MDIVTSEREYICALCDVLKGQLNSKLMLRSRVSFALSGGETPLKIFETLRNDSSIDWARIDFFWTDERAVEQSSESSNYGQARRNLFDFLDCNVNLYPWCGEAKDPFAEAVRYDNLLKEKISDRIDNIPVLDVVLLGIGADGHCASLFPGANADLMSIHNTVSTCSGADMPRFSMTFQLINRARSCIVIVNSPDKKAALSRARKQNKPNIKFPLSFLSSVKSESGHIFFIQGREK